MNLLFVGGEKGSWRVRGHQVGSALGARITAKPKPEDWIWADLIVLVKRAPYTWTSQVMRARERALLIWDVLDFWMQPSANQRLETDLLRDVEMMQRSMRIAKLIGATQAMATAIGGVYIPHHCRIGLEPAPIRPHLKVVAYDGSERFLGPWRGHLEKACAHLGLTFAVNPADLRDADLLVAFRGGEWDGWACRQWKSGVKYVNAIAAGRPILTQASAAFDELRPAGTVVEDPRQLSDAILSWASVEARQHVYEQSRKRAGAFTLEAIARQYRALLQSVSEVAA